MKKVFIIILLFIITTIIYAFVYEDFTTYTELDPGDDITLSATKVNCVNLATMSNNDSRVYYDYGAGFFGGDFTHYVTIYGANAGTTANPFFWTLANVLKDESDMRTSQDNHLSIGHYNTALYIIEGYGASVYSDNYGTGAPYTLYLTIKRVESVGTYGILYCHIFSDANRTTRVDSIGLLLHGKVDFQYLYAMNSWAGGLSNTWTGYTQNLDIGSSVAAKNVIVVN